MATPEELQKENRILKKEKRELEQKCKEYQIREKLYDERLKARTEEKSEWIKKFYEKTIDDCVAEQKNKAEYQEKLKKDQELIETFDKQVEVQLDTAGVPK